MASAAPRSFGMQLKALREAAGYTQEELATIAGLSVHAVSALERGQRRRPQPDTVRALSAALDLNDALRDAFTGSARGAAEDPAGGLAGPPLPLPLTPLLGREADVQVLQAWLADASVRLVTLTGPGGVGKTRVALELAREIAAGGAVRLHFLSLAAIRDPAFVASAIAEVFGVSDVSALELPERARAACDDQPTLLILDNFEQVLGAAPLVAMLLSAVPALRLLVTSRAPLRVRGEREYPLGPLPVDAEPDVMSPPTAACSPAVQLFAERVRDVQPDFSLTPANGPCIAAICRRLDALPLALELAAPWMKVLSPDNLLRRLEDDVLPPLVGSRDLPERQQTMNATVAWSYQLLNPDERHAFRRFGVLPGAFPIEAGAAVLAGARDERGDSEERALAAVAGLIDKSLLTSEPSVVPTCGLFRMLETVRAYAAFELTGASERDDAMEGLVRYCTREASLAADGLVGPTQVQWLDRVREDLESHRAALAWLVEHNRPAEASRIVWPLAFFWIIRGHAAEGRWWYEQILTLPSLPPAVESRSLLGAAMMCYSQGDHERARASATRASALAQSDGDADIVAQAEHLLGHVERAVNNLKEADRRFTHSMDAFSGGTNPWGRGLVLSGMAAVALANGDDARAEQLLEKAASALRDAGPWFLSLGLYVRALLAVRQGDADRAIRIVRENLTNIRELRDAFAFVYSLPPLAIAAVVKTDYVWAARILGAWDAITERTGVSLIDADVHLLREQAEQAARARLGSEPWGVAYTAGRRLSIDAMLEEIDDALRPPPQAGA